MCTYRVINSVVYYYKVYTTLNGAGISPCEVEGLERCFSDTSIQPFLGLETKYRQWQYLKEHLNLIVRKVHKHCTCSVYRIYPLAYRNLLQYYWDNDKCGRVVAPNANALLRKTIVITFPFCQLSKLFVKTKELFQRLSLVLLYLSNYFVFNRLRMVTSQLFLWKIFVMEKPINLTHFTQLMRMPCNCSSTMMNLKLAIQ